jgi:signal transduction histidine kinase
MSFRTRLVLAAAYLLGTVVLALEIPLALNVQRRATSELEASVLGNAALLAAQSADLVAAAGRRPAASTPAHRRLRTLLGDATVSDEGRVIVTDGRGRLLADSEGVGIAGEPYATDERPELTTAIVGGEVDTRRRHSDTLGDDLLLVTVPVVDNQRVVGAVRVSEPMAAVTASVHGTWLRLALIGLAVIASGLALAWILAGTLARPLERLSAAAARLGQGELDTRVKPRGPRELVSLGDSFNQMAGALGANIAAQRDFIANASHQLRTPLTGVKLRLEAIRDGGGPAAEQAARAESEVDRLNTLVDDLLSLARATSLETTGVPVDLAEAAGAAIRRWSGPVETAGQHLSLGQTPRAVMWGDPADIAGILDNLIENAIRYTPADTHITLTTTAADGTAAVTVSDTGPGIARDEESRIFERFYRGSNGRKAGAGTGLGLAIASELAGRWQGSIRIGPGPGAQLEVIFPQRRDEPSAATR